MKRIFAAAALIVAVLVAGCTSQNSSLLRSSIKGALAETNEGFIIKEIELEGVVSEFEPYYSERMNISTMSFKLSDGNNSIRIVYDDPNKGFFSYPSTIEELETRFNFSKEKIMPIPKVSNGNRVIVRGFLTNQGMQVASLYPSIWKAVYVYSLENRSFT